MTIPRDLYGSIGVIFSSIYLAASLINLGFDESLGAFFHTHIINKNNALRLFYFLIPNLIAALCGSVGIYMWGNGTPALLLIAAAITLIESIKRTIKTILHLSMHIKKVAISESVMMLIYIAVVWSSYFCTGYISYYHIFVPLLVGSAFQATFFTTLLFSWYKQLPVATDHDHPLPIRRIIKNRMFTYLSQLNDMLISSNALVPFAAYFFGIHVAAYAKLFGSVTHTVGIIVQKICGSTSSIMFALTKGRFTIKRHYHIALTTLSASSIVVIIVYMTLHQSWSDYHFLPIVCIPIVESISIMYKKWFIIKERAATLFCIASSVTIMIIGILTITADKALLPSFLTLLPLAKLLLLSAISMRERSM